MTEPTAEPELDAYALLSKPTLQLTDAEVELVVEDLRRRRKAYQASGKADKIKKPAGPKPTKESKAAATAALLAGLDLKVP